MKKAFSFFLPHVSADFTFSRGPRLPEEALDRAFRGQTQLSRRMENLLGASEMNNYCILYLSTFHALFTVEQARKEKENVEVLCFREKKYKKSWISSIFVLILIKLQRPGSRFAEVLKSRNACTRARTGAVRFNNLRDSDKVRLIIDRGRVEVSLQNH